MSDGNSDASEALVWSGRPSIGAYLLLYGAIAILAAVAVATIEWYFGSTFGLGSTILPASISLGSATIPYPVEIATVIIILFLYFVEIFSLIMVWARSRYELHNDGLYVNTGIVNLENAFIAPMAFSDARLYRSLLMRIVKRGRIIVDTNDERQFALEFLKDPVKIQQLIRRSMARPMVRVERNI